MIERDIRVGVVGVGFLGRIHAAKYAAMKGVELVGVADHHQQRADEVAQKMGVAAFNDYHSLLDQVDAASIVVSTTSHLEVGRACVERGVHMLVEKPMTASLKQADELIAAAAAKNLVLQVGLIERYNPALVAVRPYITEPLFIESHRMSPFKGRGADVDVVLDMMIHDIDIILSMVPAPLVTVHSVGVPVVTGQTDIANARLIFANGCTANITVSRISRETMRRTRIFQPFSYISVDFALREFLVLRPQFTLDGGVPRMVLDAAGLPVEETIQQSFADSDQLQDELADFVRCVRTGEKPAVSGEDGRKAMEVANQIARQNEESMKACQGILARALAGSAR